MDEYIILIYNNHNATIKTLGIHRETVKRLCSEGWIPATSWRCTICGWFI